MSSPTLKAFADSLTYEPTTNDMDKKNLEVLRLITKDFIDGVVEVCADSHSARMAISTAANAAAWAAVAIATKEG